VALNCTVPLLSVLTVVVNAKLVGGPAGTGVFSFPQEAAINNHALQTINKDRNTNQGFGFSF